MSADLTHILCVHHLAIPILDLTVTFVPALFAGCADSKASGYLQGHFDKRG